MTFTVKRVQKGGMAVGETFVLFQNGNHENRFDEDPNYKMGHRYLLFLTDRGDGQQELRRGPQGRPADGRALRRGAGRRRGAGPPRVPRAVGILLT